MAHSNPQLPLPVGPAEVTGDRRATNGVSAAKRAADLRNGSYTE